jgi:uncharacterized membrane protein
MYTKARIAEHPIHPMLVAFPIALYVATVVSLFAFIGTKDFFWYRAATYANIAAVVMAVLAAIPGLIDLVSLPEHSRARATGLRHAAFNTLSLVMFGISAVILGHNWFTRYLQDGYYVLDTAAPLVLGLIGLASTAMAGYLGWTLVQKHHVGVTPTRRDGYRAVDEVDDLDELAAGHKTERMAPPPVAPTHRVTMRH